MTTAIPADRRPWAGLLGMATAATLAILLWGPAKLRMGDRPVEAALSGDLDAYAILEALFWVGAGGALVASLAPLIWPRIAAASGALLWFLAYAGVALASAAWSPLPAYTLFFALKIPLFIGLCLGLAERARRGGGDPLAVLLGVFFSVHLAQLAVIALLYQVDPGSVMVDNPWDGGLRLTGGWLDDYGIAGGTTVLFCAWVCARRQLGTAGLLLLAGLAATGVVFLLLSRTRTTMVGTALGLLVFLPLARSLIARWWWLLIGPALLLLLAATDSQLLDWLNRGQTREMTLTFSRRTDAFSFLVDAWEGSPLGGYGYAAGQRIWMLEFMESTGIGLGVAHDALSRVLIDLGLIGLVPLAASLLAGLYETGRCYVRAIAGGDRRRRADAAMVACLATMVLAQCMANSSLSGGSPLWLLLLACLPYLADDSGTAA